MMYMYFKKYVKKGKVILLTVVYVSVYNLV